MARKSLPLNKWPLLLWLGLLALGGWIVGNAHFTADFSAFLPAAPTPKQQLLVDQLQEGVVSKLLLIAIEGGDLDARAQASRQFAERLRASKTFAMVNNGEPHNQQRDGEFLLRNRYLLSPAVSAQRFSVEGLRDAIGDSIDLLSSPAGLAAKNLIARDPTGEMSQLLDQMNPGSAPAKYRDVWISADKQRALLLAQTRSAGSDTDAQEAALKELDALFAGLDNNAQLQLKVSGPGVFSVHARAAIRAEAERLSTLSLLFISVFLFAIYRSWRVLLLGLLPVATGIVAGVAAVAQVFGNVHGITLGFGTTLIGEAVDYAIYFFLLANGSDDDRWRKRFWPTIRLGVAVSICGFAALLLSGFPGLAQLGLYSIAGIGAAAATTRFVLPLLLPPRFHIEAGAALGRLLLQLVALGSRMRWLCPLLAIAATALLAVRHEHLWNPNLASLSPVSAAEQALDAKLRADLNAPDVRYMLVTSAPEREAALQRAERVMATLQTLIDAGAIGGLDSPARYLPSAALQTARQRALPDATTLQNNLRQALQGQPLRADKLDDFIGDVEAARTQPLLRRDDLTGTSFAFAVDSLLIERGDGWHALLPLQAGSGDLPAREIRAALSAAELGDTWLVDLLDESNQLYSSYFHAVQHLSLAGVAAIFALLFASLRSFARVLKVAAPLVLAVLVVTALLVSCGQQLTLFHLIGLLLTVAIGSNYALFFSNPTLEPRTLAALLIANCTTVAGFGLLAFSKAPILQSLGVTVGPGAILALIFAALLARPNEPGAAQPRQRNLM